LLDDATAIKARASNINNKELAEDLRFLLRHPVTIPTDIISYSIDTSGRLPTFQPEYTATPPERLSKYTAQEWQKRSRKISS
jgi:hypothetical protein